MERATPALTTFGSVGPKITKPDTGLAINNIGAPQTPEGGDPFNRNRADRRKEARGGHGSWGRGNTKKRAPSKAEKKSARKRREAGRKAAKKR